MTDDELDQLQSYAFRWWIDYRLSQQFRVADVIHKAIGLNQSHVPEHYGHQNYNRTEAEAGLKLQAKWISTMRAVRDSASSLAKPNMNAVWAVQPRQVWEWAVVHDTNLAFVDANIRYLLLAFSISTISITYLSLSLSLFPSLSLSLSLSLSYLLGFVW